MVRSFQDVRLFQRLSCLQNVAMGVQGQPGERVFRLLRQHRGSPRRRASADPGQGHGVARVRRAWTTSPTCPPARSPTASRSWCRWPACWRPRPRCSCSTSRPAASTAYWVDTMLGLVESLRSQGRTICIVEHNLHVVGRLADHVYFMELGRITAEGTIDELTGSARLAEAYFGTVRRAGPSTGSPPTVADAAVLAVERPARRLRPQAGRVRRQPPRRRRRGGHAPRPQRVGQDHHDQDHPRAVPGAGRSGHLPRPRRHQGRLPLQRAGGHGPHPVRAVRVPGPDA